MITNMKIEDLRIGNWILGTNSERKSELKPFQVYAETFSDIESTYGIFEPIPLSEDILLKCGFEKHKHDIRYYQYGSLKLKVNEKGFKFQYGESISYYHYLHQIQNLYFILNNSELKINL